LESMPALAAPVTVGVDTHLDLHVAAVVDQTGRLLSTKEFAASTRGYVALVTWAERFGTVERIGVEGTGTYGAGLARFARAYGLPVVEVNRPDRSLRRRRGKSDPIDAQAAARATLAGVAATAPKTREGQVEMIRVLRVARRGALKARVAAAHQLYGVLYSAPEELRQPLLGLKTKALVGVCAAMRPGPLTSPPAATKASLRTLARRWQQLQSELTQLDTQLQQLVTSIAPTLSPCPGLGSTPPGSCWSPPATTPNGSAQRPPSRICAAPPPSRHPRAAPTATDSTAAATARPTTPCGASRWSGCAATHRPERMWNGAPSKGCPSSTSCAVSSATSPARSTTTSPASHPALPPLARNRSHPALPPLARNRRHQVEPSKLSAVANPQISSPAA
jgi:transposase